MYLFPKDAPFIFHPKGATPIMFFESAIYIRIGILAYVGIWAYFKYHTYRLKFRKPSPNVFEIEKWHEYTSIAKNYGWIIGLFVIAICALLFPTAMVVDQKPQRAITEYKVLSQAGGHLSWVLFSPKTGRTHQLRVHSALCLHAPIVGDILYGNNKKLDGALRSMLETNNLFLLAYRITFRHPSTGKMLTINAPIPDFMLPVIKFLEFKLP